MIFKVGDKVSWAGVNGVVVKDWKFRSPEAASLEVEFDALQTGGTTPGAVRPRQSSKFMYDGRIMPWHIEPSLKKRD